ncbi:MAG: FAD:protein FMN transferase [Deltaproteobacteria bacterium]|nr:FAD:protein FMN transferase [Deltaproteobacteria bacterium]
MNNARKRSTWRLGVVGASVCVLVWTSYALGCSSDGRYLMGTVLEITLCDPSSNIPQQTMDGIFASVARLETLLSTFSPDSAVSLLNAHAGQGPRTVPPEVTDLLTQSRHYWHLTRGTFDITIGPLLHAWNTAGTTHTLPSPTALRRLKTKVGSEKIAILADGRVALASVGMSIDLGGIAKGYALDQAAHELKVRGIAHALLDFGQSSIWALGAPADAPRWRLLVQRPDGREVGVIALHDQALSISASFSQRSTIQGRHYGHILDPRSGQPLQRDLLACVIAPNATQAEALSKALLILGEKEGIALLERLPGVEGLLNETQGRQWMTSGWQRATAFAARP